MKQKNKQSITPLLFVSAGTTLQRAIYCCLPPFFLLDATPGAENAKKTWREAFVKTLKDIILREAAWVAGASEGRSPPPRSLRHTAYRYPTAEEVAAVRAKWAELESRIAEDSARLPALRGELEEALAEYDKVTIESREVGLRELLTKDTLREWVKDAKQAVVKARKVGALVGEYTCGKSLSKLNRLKICVLLLYINVRLCTRARRKWRAGSGSGTGQRRRSVTRRRHCSYGRRARGRWASPSRRASRRNPSLWRLVLR